MLAAAAGSAKAYTGLGKLTASGWGTTVADPAAAALLWWAAAARGGAAAMYDEGVLYEFGLGETADEAKAKAWYERAAALNNTRARDALKRIAAGNPGAAP